MQAFVKKLLFSRTAIASGICSFLAAGVLILVLMLTPTDAQLVSTADAAPMTLDISAEFTEYCAQDKLPCCPDEWQPGPCNPGERLLCCCPISSSCSNQAVCERQEFCVPDDYDGCLR